MNGLIRFGLGLAGLPSATAADLDKAMPGIGRLIATAKQLDPILRKLEPIGEQAMPHIKALLPLLEQAMPLIDQATPVLKAEYPDFAAVLPVLQQLAAFVQK